MSGESEIKVENLEFQDVIEEAKNKVCERYNSGFRKKYEKAKNEERNEEIFAFRTLSMATSFTFNPENVEEPFDAMMIMQGSRTAIPDDLSSDHLNLINAIIQIVSDPELKARLADILWIRNRDFEKAKIAINSYLDSADHLQNEELYQAIGRLERALRLANSLVKGQKTCLVNQLLRLKPLLIKLNMKIHLVLLD